MKKGSIVCVVLYILSTAVSLSAQVTVAVHPVRIPVTFTGEVQFTAKVTGSTSGVVWAVDGVIGGNSTTGTITTSGLYRPPAKVGMHTVAAKVSGTTFKGTAKAFVSNCRGVLTYQNNNQRTGLNSAEIALTPSSVNHTTFGKLFTYPTDGYFRNQPLYMANVLIPKLGYRNLVFVATEHDSLYAFDADGLQSTPIWQVNFTDAAHGVTTIPSSVFSTVCDYCTQPEFGITATPVIDPNTKTIYVVARTQEVTNSVTRYVYRLHALDVATGLDPITQQEKFGAPVVIQATAPGTGVGSVGGVLTFDPLWQMVRSALLLSKGTVYIASASLGDAGPYHGWVIGYSAGTGTLQQTGVFVTTPNGSRGGIWQDGAGLSADPNGNIYFSTGNGTFNANTGGKDYGESVIKLTPNPVDGSLALTDYFTPFDQAKLNTYDWDLSSAGWTLLPDQAGTFPHLAIGGGKEGTIYVVNRDSLGGYNASSNDQIVQSIEGQIRGSVPGQIVNGIWNEPAYWNGYVYIFGLHDVLKAFQMVNGSLSTTPVFQGTVQLRAPTPVISSNGNSTPLIWVLQWDQSVLHAFNYNNLATQIYGTNQVPTRDAPDGRTSKSAPIVANGRVYVGTQTNLDVYGFLP
jgi:hypothetical protein